MTRFGILTDIHYKPSVHETIVSELESVVTTFRTEVEPDRVVVLGDIVHSGTSSNESGATVVREVLDEVSCPVQYLPGNHDAADAESPERWQELYGNGRWRVDHDQSLAFLNSSAPRLNGPRGEIDDSQLARLAAHIDEWARGLLFVHHPLYPADTSTNRWFKNAPEEAICGNKEAVWDRLEGSKGVAAVLNGHLHQYAHGQYRGVDHFTLESFTKELVPEEEYGSYVVVERTAETVSVEQVTGSGRSIRYRIPVTE